MIIYCDGACSHNGSAAAVKKTKVFFTDGSSRGNPGPGGYAAIMLNDNTLEYQYSQQEDIITNNQAELKAILNALHYIQNDAENCDYIIYSDSAYAINCLTIWAYQWESKDWSKSDNKPIKNLELIRKAYYILKNAINITLIQIKGHDNNIGNELADKLATNDMIAFTKILNKEGIKYGNNL